jgi:hypothetical protein
MNCKQTEQGDRQKSRVGSMSRALLRGSMYDDREERLRIDAE